MLEPIREHTNGHSHGDVHNLSVTPQRLPTSGLNLKRHVEQIELSLIRQALERSRGVVADAARLLCLRRTTLVEKIRKYRALNYRFDLSSAA